MNIRRWLPRRGPLIVAMLAMAGAAVIAPAPASASTTNVYCYLSAILGPSLNATGTVVSANAVVTCSGGFASDIRLNLYLARDGATVASTLSRGTLGASASVGVSCVPGNYVVTATGSAFYPYPQAPISDSFFWQSPSVYINCVARPVVANPGNQSMFLYDPASLQLTATGGAPPYTWSATGLPNGLSINPGTGLISGTGTAVANSTVTVTAVDAAGSSGSTQFTWRVRREPCPRC